MDTTVEAVRAECLCECLTNRCHGNAFAAEQVACHIGHLGVEEFVHLPHVVNPHDLQRRLQQSRQPGQAERNTRLQRDRIAVRLELTHRNVLTEECILIEERVAE
jgi:hypothetical protein